MMFRFVLTAALLMGASLQTQAAGRDANQLFQALRSRMDAVRDYTADIKMSIDVSYMRIPTLRGKLYFKNPDKMKLERHGGISILPKKSMSLSLSSLVPAGDATIIDVGYEETAGEKLRVIKVVPGTEQTDIVLTKIWVDEAQMLAKKIESTTRENGTVHMDMTFGRYAHLALPDRVVFYVDVRELKMPKSVTMDYDDGSEALIKKEKTGKPRKGRIKIDYLSYQVNVGLDDRLFIEKKR